MTRGVETAAAANSSRAETMELLRQHVEAPLVRVDGQLCERPPLADRVALSRKRYVEHPYGP
jgi:hypothetical protein